MILSWALISATPAGADGVRLDWPLRPPPAVARGFDAPSPNWNRGHRGIDLPGPPAQPVYAAGSATVVFAGMLAGRPVVSLAHPGGLHTSYEPVQTAVRVGQPVTSETVIGELMPGRLGCPAAGAASWQSGPGVGLIVHRPQPGDRDMGVKLRGRQTGMAEQLLDDPQVGPTFEQVGGRAVPQAVRPHIGRAVHCSDGLVHDSARLACI